MQATKSGFIVECCGCFRTTIKIPPSPFALLRDSLSHSPWINEGVKPPRRPTSQIVFSVTTVAARECIDRDFAIVLLIPLLHHVVETPVVIIAQLESFKLHSSYLARMEIQVQVRIRQKMWQGDYGAEIRKFAADNLSVCHVYVDDSELLQPNDIPEELPCTECGQILVTLTKLLDDAPNGWVLAIFTRKARAHILIPGVIHIPVEVELEIAELIHHSTLVLFVKK